MAERHEHFRLTADVSAFVAALRAAKASGDRPRDWPAQSRDEDDDGRP